MSSAHRRMLALATVVCVLAAPLLSSPLAARAATTRTVYVTITDEKGAPVTDLTAANFKVKEGGKDREIVKAAPATTKPRICALMVEERLIGDTQARVGLFEFVKRMNGAAEISLDHALGFATPRLRRS